MTDTVYISAWARSAVAPVGGALSRLSPHELATPVLHAVLERAGVDRCDVDALVLGNALGAGGNPARMLALAAGLEQRTACYSVDTQCCSGLDAVSMGMALIRSGQARCVIAGGVEAWSRAPQRLHRPVDGPPIAYERPPFAPDPQDDPDLLQAAADYARRHGYGRAVLDDWACRSHARAVLARSHITAEIVPVAGLAHDSYPRAVDARTVARLPEAAPGSSVLAVSPRADGAALVVLQAQPGGQAISATRGAAFEIAAAASVGADPRQPMLAAADAAQAALQRAGVLADALVQVELHDAFAAQGLQFVQALGLPPERLNPHGGGIARGHPIAASGTIALVRLLADMALLPYGAHSTTERYGLAAIAGAGGLGAAVLVRHNHRT